MAAPTWPHARLLARFNHTQISWWLAAKRALHLQPMTTICVTCGCHLLVVSYVHMTLERGLALPDGGDDDADDARARLTEFPQLLGDELVTALWIHLQAIRFAFVPPCTHGARALLALTCGVGLMAVINGPARWTLGLHPYARGIVGTVCFFIGFGISIVMNGVIDAANKAVFILFLENPHHGHAHCHERRLGVLRQGELLLGALKDDAAESGLECVVNLLEDEPRGGKCHDQAMSHTNFLASLSGENECS